MKEYAIETEDKEIKKYIKKRAMKERKNWEEKENEGRKSAKGKEQVNRCS